MKRRLAGFILKKIMGWKLPDEIPGNYKKSIFVMAPHTSNWDFIIGKLGSIVYGLNIKFLVKKELFFPPLGWLLKWSGAVPVDRSKKNNLVQELAKLYPKEDNFHVVFTPEGTRSATDNWKKGFFYLAKEANVPIVCCVLNFKDKQVGFFVPQLTGNDDEDIKAIRDRYIGVPGKHPEKGVKKID